MSSVRIVRFRDLERWDIGFHFGIQDLKSKFKLEFLEKILMPRKEKIKPDEYDGLTPIVAKIPFTSSHIELRKEPKTKMDMYAVYNGDLLVSNINFHQGAVAICKESKICASTHYQPYIVNEKIINKDFLYLMLKQKSYLKYIATKRTKGIKTESNFKFIKTLQIPLPPLEIQNEIISKLKALEDKIKVLEKEKIEINKSFYKLLGMETERLTSGVKIVKFKDLERWDIKNYLENIKSNYPLVNLTNLIFENKNKIKPFLYPNDDFDILGVDNKNGVFFNETLKGSQIKQPYIKVKSGDIFYNPYRVNVGSIGIVPAEFDAKFTSPAYVVFSIDENKLRREFLLLILKSPHFNQYLRSKTIGSVRQILSFKALQDLQIPLPPLAAQNKLISKQTKVDEEMENLSKKLEQVKERAIKDLW